MNFLSRLLSSVVLGLALLSLVACATPVLSTPTAETAVVAQTARQHVRQVVGKLTFSDGPESPSYCSAVVIADYQALSAAHCYGENVYLIMEDGRVSKVLEFKLDPSGQDLAYLTLETPMPYHAVLTLGPAVRDEPALAVGYPLMAGQYVTDGHIQGRAYVDLGLTPAVYLTTSTMSAPGNSGGGLFVIRGGIPYLVGIVVGGSNPYQHIVFAVELNPAQERAQ